MSTFVSGDTYEDALRRERRVGAARADDAAIMAGFCQTVLQHVAGAVSPKLVWQGAQAKAMRTKDLMRLAHDDPMAVSDLQWL